MEEKQKDQSKDKISKNNTENDMDFYHDFSDLMDYGYGDRYRRKIERKIRRKLDRKLRRIGRGHSRFPGYPGIQQFGEDQEIEPGQMTWENYKKIITERADKARAGFSSHLGSYVAVNVALFVVNLVTSFSFPWFLFVLGGWGIGMICHTVDCYLKQKHKKDVEKLPPLSPEALSVFHKLKRNKYHFFNHLGAYVGVNGFLFLVNLITSMSFPWFAIPAGLWAMGLFSHLLSFRVKNSILKKKLKALIGKIGAVFTKSKKSDYSNDDPMMTQVYELKDSIIEEIETASQKGMPIDSDLKPVLENYMKQVENLNSRYNEIDGLIRSIPMSELESDLVKLKKKSETIFM